MTFFYVKKTPVNCPFQLPLQKDMDTSHASPDSYVSSYVRWQQSGQRRILENTIVKNFKDFKHLSCFPNFQKHTLC